MNDSEHQVSDSQAEEDGIRPVLQGVVVSQALA